MDNTCKSECKFHWGNTTFQILTCEKDADHQGDHRNGVCIWNDQNEMARTEGVMHPTAVKGE